MPVPGGQRRQDDPAIGAAIGAAAAEREVDSLTTAADLERGLLCRYLGCPLGEPSSICGTADTGELGARRTSVEADRAGAFCHHQQKASRDRNVLEEHDHLYLVSEVVVEKERGQQREAGK